MRDCFCPHCMGIPPNWIKGWSVWDWHQALVISGYDEGELRLWEDFCDYQNSGYKND